MWFNPSEITRSLFSSRHALILLYIFLVSVVVGYYFQSVSLPSSSLEFINKTVGEDSGVSLVVEQDKPLTEGRQGVVKVRKLVGSDKLHKIETSQGAVVPNDSGFDLIVEPAVPGYMTVKVVFGFEKSGGELIREDISIPIYVAPSALHRFELGSAFALPTLGILLGLYYWSRSRERYLSEQRAKIASADEKAEKESEKARPAWIAAQIRLEAYFDRNLQQVNQVFFVSIGVMIVGFIFVAAAIALTLHDSSTIPVAKVTGGVGLVTEFIGATFMVIYRSTMTQANKFMNILERINTVGMSVQVLDSMSETHGKLKNETRAHIVDLLLRASNTSRTLEEETEEERSGSKDAESKKK
jgi:hypothetical protein